MLTEHMTKHLHKSSLVCQSRPPFSVRKNVLSFTILVLRILVHYWSITQRPSCMLYSHCQWLLLLWRILQQNSLLKAWHTPCSRMQDKYTESKLLLLTLFSSHPYPVLAHFTSFWHGSIDSHCNLPY